MFSKNAYMSSPSSHPRSSASVVGLNASDFFLHQYHHLHHHDMLSGHHFAAALYNQDVGGLNVDPSAMAVNHPCTAKAAASKKDRHSKINTAQGPRDRRVRLSIGVARKFFDLQEILGFDKPSKTLDWLLTKSETAINDVEQMREKASTDAAAAKSYNSECEVDSSDVAVAFQNGADFNHRLKGAAAKADSTSNLVKESRAKARARARERTREKMCIKKQLNETRSNNGGCDNLSPIQFMNNQLEFRKISSAGGSSSSISTNNINVGFHQNYEASAAAAANEDLIEESIVIKRKVKHPSMMGFQQNLIISSSNYGVPAPYNNAASENWDNICAILDQHKFINSTSNN